eukprot:scaffold3505_cov98-Cylindrotheca_fusiformis.AAC.4
MASPQRCRISRSFRAWWMGYLKFKVYRYLKQEIGQANGVSSHNFGDHGFNNAMHTAYTHSRMPNFMEAASNPPLMHTGGILVSHIPYHVANRFDTHQQFLRLCHLSATMVTTLKKSYAIPSSELVGREKKSLDALMVAARTVAEHPESDIERLSEVTQIDEFILTEMCKEVAYLFGEDVDELDNKSLVCSMRKSMAGILGTSAPDSSLPGDEARRFSISDEDEEEQRKILQVFEEQKRRQLKEKQDAASRNCMEPEQNWMDMIEVEPGVSLPLQSSGSTFRAIVTGETTTTTCFGCQQVLTTPSDVAFVVCSDCWICMAVNQQEVMNGRPLQPGTTIGLGIKDEAIAKWLEKRNSFRL